MVDACRDAIRDGLAAKLSLGQLLAILRQHKDAGLQQADAYKLLDELRADRPEDEDDLILELLDVVVGFCSPHMRLWPEPYAPS
jgi:hypothetical protein